MVFPVMNNSLKNTKRMFQYNTSLIMATTLEKLILEKLIKNEDFNKFLSTLNGRLPSPSGDIVKKPNIKFGSDKNAAYREIQSSGWLSDPQYAAAIQYDGIYVEVPVMCQVLNNQQTRERANLKNSSILKWVLN